MRTTQVTLLILALNLCLIAGCTKASETASPSATTTITEELPVFKVDQVHSHLIEDESIQKSLTYKLSNHNGFILDTTGYKIALEPPKEKYEPTVQIVLGKNDMRSAVYDPKVSKYRIDLKGKLKTGQMVLVGIGYLVRKKDALQFYADWVSMVEVL